MSLRTSVFRTRRVRARCLVIGCGGDSAGCGGAASPSRWRHRYGQDNMPRRTSRSTTGKTTKNQLIVQKGRKGYWYTFVDKAGSTLSPPAGHTFLMSPGGVKGSTTTAAHDRQGLGGRRPALRGHGLQLHGSEGPVRRHRVLGRLVLREGRRRLDEDGAPQGARRQHGPGGKNCTECFNDFGSDLTLTDKWQKYTIPFAQR